MSGTDSFRVSSPSVKFFAGGAGGRELLQKVSLPFFTSFHPIISAQRSQSRRDGVRASAGSVPATASCGVGAASCCCSSAATALAFSPGLRRPRGFEGVLLGFAGTFQRPCEVVRCGPQQGILPSANGSRKFWPPRGARLPPTKNGVRKLVKLAEFPERVPYDDGPGGDGPSCFERMTARSFAPLRSACHGLTRCMCRGRRRWWGASCARNVWMTERSAVLPVRGRRPAGRSAGREVPEAGV